jgi:hypothetical protein
MLEFRRVFVLLVVVLLAFCGRKETSNSSVAPASTATTSTAVAPPAAAPAPAAEQGLATADGETPGVTATVKELKRSSGGIVSLKFVITNASAKAADVGYNYGDPDHHIGDHASVGGVQLIDQAGKKKYFVARDSEGNCVCSRGLKDIAPGTSLNAWARFPAPPDDVKKISVIIPHFSPLDDVPIAP